MANATATLETVKRPRTIAWGIRRERRAQLLAVLATGLIYVAIVAITAIRYGGNISALIVAGQEFVQRYPGNPGHHIVVYRHTSYDGLAYYYIAGNPFMRAPNIHDALRYQRIGYPFLVWALSLGRQPWQPFMMVLVNLIAVMAVAYIAGEIIHRYAEGAGTWWAVACAVTPALIIGVQNDLAEPLLTALALGGLLLYLRGRVLWSALALAGAMLTREVGILFLPPLLVGELAERRWARFATLALAVAPALIWQAVMKSVVGYSSAGTIEENFQPFLVGIGRVLAGVPSAPAWERIHIPGIVGVMVLVVAALIVAVAQGWRRYDVVIGAIIVHCAVALFGGWVIWQGYRSAGRVFGGVYPLIIFAYLRYGYKRGVWGNSFAPLAGLLALLTLYVLLTQVIFAPVQSYYVTP